MNSYPPKNRWKKVNYDTHSELSLIIFASELDICNKELLRREKENSIHPDLAYMCRDAIDRCLTFISELEIEKLRSMILLEKNMIIVKIESVYELLDIISRYEKKG